MSAAEYQAFCAFFRGNDLSLIERPPQDVAMIDRNRTVAESSAEHWPDWFGDISVVLEYTDPSKIFLFGDIVINREYILGLVYMRKWS